MPGKRRAWTLQHYGAYVVVETHAPGFDITVEDDPNGSKLAEFQKDWNFAMEQKVANNTTWVRDIEGRAKALYVVNDREQVPVPAPEPQQQTDTPRKPAADPGSRITTLLSHARMLHLRPAVMRLAPARDALRLREHVYLCNGKSLPIYCPETMAPTACSICQPLNGSAKA